MIVHRKSFTFAERHCIYTMLALFFFMIIQAVLIIMAKDGLQDMLSIVLNKDVRVMCNLSQGIVDETRAETRAETKAESRMNMYENNFTVQQISLATKQSVEEVEGIIKEHKSVLV